MKDIMAMFEHDGYQVVKPGSQINYIPDGKGGRRPVVSQMDLFGAFDLIAIRSDRPTMFIQVCNKNPGAVAARRKKIEAVDLPVTDVAVLCVWHGGGKVLDRRYRKESRYKPFQYFEISTRVHTSCPMHRKPDDVDLEEGWYWHPSIKVFLKVQLKNRCWACNRTLSNDGWCPQHPWANNKKVIL